MPPTLSPQERPLQPSENGWLHQAAQPDIDEAPLYAGHLAQCQSREIQCYADRHDTKWFYDALKAVYGPQSSGSSPVLRPVGTTLFIEKRQILER